jgi:serine/threonine protein kinase/WD40 repeat protein
MRTSDLDSLIGDLRRLAILEEDQLALLDHVSERGGSREDLGKELQERGWMTPFQIEQVINGSVERLSLGQYVILEQLGSGGMGEVFKARHRLMHRIVAIKIIRRESITNQASLQRFYREIRAAAQLTHPNVVLAYDADKVGDTHYMVMEYVPGVDLGQFVKERGLLPVTWACEFIRQAAMGLHHAHERNLVHRDVKPSNLLLTWTEGVSHPGMYGPGSNLATGPQAVVKVLDLGLARLRESTTNSELTHEGQFMGTPDFVAPEQAMAAHDADHRADIYSLGCTLYFFLTGQVPFPGNKVTEKLLKHQLDQPVSVMRVRPETPLAVAEIVEKMMAKQPDDRYPDCAELVMALLPFCQTVTYTDFLETLPRPASADIAGIAETDTRQTMTPPSIADNDAMVVLHPTNSIAASMLGTLAPNIHESPRTPSPTRTYRSRPDTMTTGRPWFHRRRRVVVFLGLLIALMGTTAGASLFTIFLSGAPDTRVAAAAPSPATENRTPTEPTGNVVATLPTTTTVRVTPTVSVTPKTHKPSQYALLLGISNYASDELKPLRYAEKDVTQLAKLLRLNYDIETNVLLLTQTNAEQNPRWLPRKKEFRTELTNLLAHRIKGDSVVVALACHAVQFEGDRECYLCPLDARLSDRESLIPLSAVYDELGRCQAGFKLLLLDVTRNKPVNDSASGSVNLEAISVPQQLPVPDGVAVFFGCSPREAGHDLPNLEHGLFYGAIIQGLKANVSDLEEYTKVHVFADGVRNPSRSVRQTPLRRGATAEPVPPGGWKSMMAALPSGELARYSHTHRVTSVAFSPDGLLVASGGYDRKGSIRLWTLDQKIRPGQGEKRATFRDPDYECIVRALAFAPDGRNLLAGTGNALDAQGKEKAGGGPRETNGVHVFPLGTDDEFFATSGGGVPTLCVAFAADGRQVMAGCKDGSVKIWKFDGNQLQLEAPADKQALFPHKGAAIGSVLFGPGPNQAIYTALDGTVRVWDTVTYHKVRDLSAGTASVRCAVLSPDRRWLITGDDDGLVAVRELDTAKVRKLAQKQTGPIHSVAVSPDGSRALSGGEDGSIRLWDVLSGEPLEAFTGHKETVNSVAFSPDGRYAASGGDDKTVRLWALPVRP